MSQYFKRMATRCKPSLILGLPTKKQATKHSTDIEVHGQVIAATESVPPKAAAVADSVLKNMDSIPIVSTVALIDQPDMITVATNAPQNIEMGEPLSKMIPQSENIDKPGHITVNRELGITANNILLQENELTPVNHPEPEANLPETHKQPPPTVKLSTAVESELPEPSYSEQKLAEQNNPEQNTFFQPVEGSTYNREITIAKLAGDKQAENIPLVANQPLTPTLVKEKSLPQTTTEHQVNIKIGKIDLEVHQPQAPAKPVSVKPAPRSNRQHSRGNNLSRYYLRGGMD